MIAFKEVKITKLIDVSVSAEEEAAGAAAAAAAIHKLWPRIRVAVICKLFHRHLLLKWECFNGL